MPGHDRDRFYVSSQPVWDCLAGGCQLPGTLAASARFDDEITDLKEAGVHAAYNFYAEAGTGLAEHVFEEMAMSGNEKIETNQ